MRVALSDDFDASFHDDPSYRLRPQRQRKWTDRPMAEWRERGYVPDSDDELSDNDLQPKLSPLTFPEEQTAQAIPHEGETLPCIGEDSHNHGYILQTIEKIANETESNPQPQQHGQTLRRLPSATHQGSSDGDGLAANGSLVEASDIPLARQEGTEKFGSVFPVESVGDRFQAEVEIGLQTVKEILAETYGVSGAQSVARDQTSSPLSSIRSFSDEDDQVSTVKDKPIDQQAKKSELTHADRSAVSPAPPLGRDLRQRNPIQLHPYALEDARYQQELKARGLKPLRNALSGHPRPRSLTAFGTQSQDLFSSSPVTESDDTEQPLYHEFPQPSQQATSPEPHPVRRLDGPQQATNDDEDLPELSVLLARNATNFPARKKRKIAYKTSKDASRQPGNDKFNVPNLPSVTQPNALNLEMDFDMVDSLPSPPRTSSSQISGGLPLPPELSQPLQHVPRKGLLTPIVSSVTKDPSRLDVEMVGASESSQDSESEDLLEAMSPTPETDAESSNNLEANEVQFNGVQKMQRKIKGVLPASWLTLDLDKHSNKPKERIKSTTSPLKQCGGKGVAHRVTKGIKMSKSGTMTANPAILVSDDSSSDTEASPVRQPPGSATSVLAEDNNDGVAVQNVDDIAEDDEIDMMISSFRPVRKSGTTGGRQRMLQGTMDRARKSVPKQSRPISTRHKQRWQEEDPDRIARRQKPRQKRPGAKFAQLGILDAPGYSLQQDIARPQFLKVAARQAKARRNKGRQDPSRKYFRLPTRADTEDVNSDLVNWREGRIIPERISHKFVPEHDSSRGPRSELSPRTSDILNLPIKTRTEPDQERTISHLKSSTEATILRILERQAGTPAARSHRLALALSQTPDSSLNITRQKHFENQLAHHKNRSGSGQLLSSISKPRGARPAQLEVARHQHHRKTSPNAFQAGLSALGSSNSGLALATSTQHTFVPRRTPEHASAHEIPNSTFSQPTRIPRKRTPQRLPISRQEHHQTIMVPSPILQATPQELAVEHVSVPKILQEIPSSPTPVFEMPIHPPSLTEGTYFHESTFIGSGGLARTLRRMTGLPRNHELDPGTQSTIRHPKNLETYLWGLWTPDVARQFFSIFNTLFPKDTSGTDKIQILRKAQVDYLIHIVNYVNNALYFEESSNQESFVKTSIAIIQRIVDQTNFDPEILPSVQGSDLLSVLNILAVFTFQSRAWHLLDSIAQWILSLAFGRNGRVQIHDFLCVNQMLQEVEKGIKTYWPEVDGVVIVQRLFDNKSAGHSFPELIRQTLSNVIHDQSLTGSSVDWKLSVMGDFLCKLQPLLDFDASGVLLPKPRRKGGVDCWLVVQQLYTECLARRNPALGMNYYWNNLGRILVTRCVGFATNWGWTNCDSFIRTMRATFFNNNLEDLWGEHSQTSPEFLENYTKDTNIVADDSDSGFVSWLKLIIVTGRNKANAGTSTNGLSNFIFSLFPNSGEVLRKERRPTAGELEHLRKCHALDATLYMLGSRGNKGRLITHLQALVDPAQSHTDATWVSCQTWERLVRHEIDANDDLASLQSLSKWYQEICVAMLKLYRFGSDTLQPLEPLNHKTEMRRLRVIASNRSWVANFLYNAIELWHKLMLECKTPDQARSLVLGDNFPRLLQWCGTDSALEDELTVAILELLHSYMWNWVKGAEQVSVLIDIIYRPVKQLLSNHLGARKDTDQVLLKLTQCWFVLAKNLVENQQRDWDNFLDPGANDSWYLFPDVKPRRQCMVYFVYAMIVSDPRQYEQRQLEILILWLCGLVTPRGPLANDELLTNCILHEDCHNPLLLDLPLMAWYAGERLRVNLCDLREARLGTVLQILRNMHKLTTQPDSQEELFSLGRREYAELLRNVMDAMTRHYQDVLVDHEAREEYAVFVNHILGEMHLYTEDIQPILPWFRNCHQFPIALETVESKLRAYSSRISETDLEKQMVSFLQSTAERAAVSGKQEEFLRQLVEVLLDITPYATTNAVTDANDAMFRTLLLQDVFPAYIERIFSDSGFILSQPTISCVSRIYRDLESGSYVNCWTEETLTFFTNATHSLLAAAKSALDTTSCVQIMSSPQHTRAYKLLFSTLLEILRRYQIFEVAFGNLGTFAEVWEYLYYFHKHAKLIAFWPPRDHDLLHDDDNDDNDVGLQQPALSAADAAILEFARKELGDTLGKRWVYEAGEWYIIGGGRRTRVESDLTLSIVAGRGLLDTRDMQRVAEDFVTTFYKPE